MIAVLVVSYRRADLLAACLASVRLHLPGAPVHVWDNASDGSDDVRRYAAVHPEVQWTFSATNVGFAAAVNALASQAGGDLLLLNPDATLTGDLAASRAALALPRTAAVAPAQADTAHRPLTLVRALVSEAGYAHRLRRTPLSDLYATPPAVVDGYLSGSCLLVARAAWDTIGGFDESFHLYGEEADWARRAVAGGWTLRLTDDPAVRHTAEGTVAGDPARQRRSRDLLHEAQAHRLQTGDRVHRADAYLAGVGALERLQRSKRRPRARGDRPAVVFTTNTLGVGGAERLQVQLVNTLARRGLDVTLTCLQAFGPLVTDVEPGVRLLRRPWWAPGSVPVHGRAVLLTNETTTEAGFATLWRAAGRERRWFVAGHTPVRDDGPTYPRPLAAAMRRADGFIALAESQWQQLSARQPVGDRHVVIGNGVAPADAVEPVADDGSVRLAMIARIVEHKNPHLLVAALERLPDLDWTLDIWGDGPDRERLEALTPASVAGRVWWRGWASDPSAAVAAADVLCQPSRAEVFPMVLLEAMARGVAVMASAVAAVPEMLDHGRAGVLVDPVTVEAWATALRELITDRPRLRALAAAGRERQLGHYTMDATADRYQELVEGAFG